MKLQGGEREQERGSAPGACLGEAAVEGGGKGGTRRARLGASEEQQQTTTERGVGGRRVGGRGSPAAAEGSGSGQG